MMVLVAEALTTEVWVENTKITWTSPHHNITSPGGEMESNKIAWTSPQHNT